jgi:hypothetical protein
LESTSALSGALDVLSFGTLVAIYQLVMNRLSFMQGFVALPDDAGMMHEDILTLILEDKAKTSSVVEPLHLSARHNSSFRE